MRALVTGSNGFVGRHIVRYLRRRGDTVIGVDDLSTGLRYQEWPSPMYLWSDYLDHFHHMDVREFFRTIEPAEPYDLIFHCAAVVGGRLKIEGDPLAVATDLSIDAEFFNWAVRLDPKPKRVVYFSSSAVYPTLLQSRDTNCALSEGFVTFDTGRIGMPDQTYGWSKLSGEYLARVAAHKYGLPVVIYRPFSGYGEDQDMSYPFPALIERVVNVAEKPMVVWGSGQQQRDFIHIDDVVEAVFASMDRMRVGETLNLGSGEGTSFEKLVQLAGRLLLPYDFDVVYDTTKPEGVFSRVADTYNLGRYYVPKISLEEGIRRVARHLDKVRQPA